MTKPRSSEAQAPRGPIPLRFQKALLGWYDSTRRDFPWRRTTDPYAIWVSEVMLQQTRTEVVLPRFERFIARFPTAESLADSAQEEVVAAWSGLGYYRRARNLHEAARVIVKDHGGNFPKDPKQAASLPGVGTYTSHAVLSIAHGIPLAVVDGNVERTLSRVSLLSIRPRSVIQKEADRLLSRDRPGDANQALMELGATICLPHSPRCGACPLRTICGAHRAEQVAAYPPTLPRPRTDEVSTTLWILRSPHGEVWLEKRSVPLLRGLWMLPWRKGRVPREVGRTAGTVTHAIVNRKYRCEIVQAECLPTEIPGEAAGPGRWVAIQEIGRLPRSSLLSKALALSGICVESG